MSAHKHPVCGRCGVYRHLHPTSRCEKSRPSFWWDRHSIVRHVAAWLWIHATTSRMRWSFIEWMNRDPERRDWCQLVDCALKVDGWDDADHGWYKSLGYARDYDDLCDFPLPWDATPPTPGWCYCPTPEQRAQIEATS